MSSATPNGNVDGTSCDDTLKLALSNGREIFLKDAIKDESNVLYRLRHRTHADQFMGKLWDQRSVIQTIVAQHLGVCTTQCVVEDRSAWIRGQFNVCVYVQVIDSKGTKERKVFRCPMPHKVGRPQSVDEKIRGEAASYAWIEQHCPEIPVPHLIGFGLSNRYQYTSTQHLPWYRRLFHHGVRLLRAISGQHIYPYAWHQSRFDFGPYLLIDFIKPSQGVMLSTKRFMKPDEQQTSNLYRGLSRIMLSLARIPHSQIGSLRFNDDRTITISQRPLLCSNILHENEGSPSAMRGTYSWNGPFLLDLLDFRAKAFEFQPNAVNHEKDCRLQMSYLVTLRAILPEFVDYAYSGPFVLQHTDLHQSNIFVDDNWNVTGLIDLEFVCSLPPDMLDVPYWLSEESIDYVKVERYTTTMENFLAVLDDEAKRISSCQPLSALIRKSWESGAFWCYHCLTSVNAMPMLMENYLHPMYTFSLSLVEEDTFAAWLSKFWSRKSEEVVQTKVADRNEYALQVQALYTEAGASATT